MIFLRRKAVFENSLLSNFQGGDHPVILSKVATRYSNLDALASDSMPSAGNSCGGEHGVQTPGFHLGEANWSEIWDRGNQFPSKISVSICRLKILTRRSSVRYETCATAIQARPVDFYRTSILIIAKRSSVYVFPVDFCQARFLKFN